jgi:tyrosine-protein kinase Etk/Wzc
MNTQTRRTDVPLEVVEDAGEQRTAPPAVSASLEPSEPALRDYIEVIIAGRWILLATTLAALMGAGIYLLIATPQYLVDALVQVEEKKSTIAGFEDLSNMFTDQSPANTEIEILRSRMLVGSVVDELHLDILAEPRYFPLIGRPVARHWDGDAPAKPALFLSSFAWGGERITVDRLDLPQSWEGKLLTIVPRSAGQYDLFDPSGKLLDRGAVGEPFTKGKLGLFISELVAREGTPFQLAKLPRARVMEKLQKDLALSEKGKKTGIIRVALQGPDPLRLTATIAAVARAYQRQNVERKSAEAAQTLEFVNAQLPELKASVDRAEAALNSYRRNRGGGLDLSIETKAALDRTAQIEKLLTEIELQRSEMKQRFTSNHPAVVALNQKAAQLRSEREALDQQFRGLPETQLNAARLMRDVKVSNELYVLLLNKAQQLQVLKSGTIGNVRVLDSALVPQEPVSPKPLDTLALALVAGAALGMAIVFTRRALYQGAEDPELIERQTGLPVYATIPHSPAQAADDRTREKQRRGLIPILALAQPDDLAVEALRSLRTSLQFALADSRNNVVCISGPSPDIGKSFIAVNVAHVLADLAKRVLLVDADMRKGHLHRYFGRSKTPGLSDLIRDAALWKEAIQKTTADNVYFLPMGDRPPNPSELLASTSFQELVTLASREFDVVIIDTPPILAVTDAMLAGRVAGTTLLVLRAGQHPLREIGVSVKRMHQNSIDLRAIVINDIMPKATAYAYSRYGYHYHYEYK